MQSRLQRASFPRRHPVSLIQSNASWLKRVALLRPLDDEGKRARLGGHFVCTFFWWLASKGFSWWLRESPRGFHKLAAEARAGPVVVTHDDELSGTSSGSTRNKGRSSVELSGRANISRSGGEEVDLISGDQLDRLLSKARNARARD